MTPRQWWRPQTGWLESAFLMLGFVLMVVVLCLPTLAGLGAESMWEFQLRVAGYSLREWTELPGELVTSARHGRWASIASDITGRFYDLPHFGLILLALSQPLWVWLPARVRSFLWDALGICAMVWGFMVGASLLYVTLDPVLFLHALFLYGALSLLVCLTLAGAVIFGHLGRILVTKRRRAA